MVVEYEGEEYEVVLKGSEYERLMFLIMNISGIGRKAARNRIKDFLAAKITTEQLLFKGSYNITRDACPITKDGITLTAPQLARQVKNLTVTAANKRLHQWQRGYLTYKDLFREPQKRKGNVKFGTKEWRELGDDERVSPKSLHVTEFEKRYGKECELAWGYVDA